VETIDPTLEKNDFKISDEFKGTLVSAVLRCTPEGITFNNPVKIAIPYYSELLPDTIPVDSIVVVSCSNDSIELVPFSIDKINKTVIADVMHFSDYAIIVKVGLLISRGKIYKTVKINGKNWMAENLAYLPNVSPPSDSSYSKPIFYVYGYDGRDVSEAKAKKYPKDYYKMYGVLYNWAAAKDACPVGWHLPTDNEWKHLEMGLGMSQIEADKGNDRGTDQGSKMKANTGWFEGNDTNPNTGNGTNTSGFSGLPGGSRHFDGVFDGEFQFGYWWGSDESICCATIRSLSYHYPTVYRTNYNKLFGYSVRCVQD